MRWLRFARTHHQRAHGDALHRRIRYRNEKFVFVAMCDGMTHGTQENREPCRDQGKFGDGHHNGVVIFSDRTR